jgi:hypothetical protein
MIVVLLSDGTTQAPPKASTCISMDGLKKAYTETGLSCWIRNDLVIWGQIQNGCLR